MRVLSVVLALWVVGLAAAQTCDGILKGVYCCSAGCGECGGSGCSDRGDGLTGDDCCTSDIEANGVACGSAPCILTDDSGPTPTPPTPTPPTPTPSGTCDDGILSGSYCCSAGCGTCGGSGCSDRGDGLTGDDCCTSDIEANGVTCGSAPCIVSDDSSGPTPTPPTPTPPTPTPSGTCDDGILSGIYCCSAGCGTCGGSGCSDRGDGLTGDDCCTSDIEANGVTCGSAPCIVSDDSSGPTPTPPTPTPPTPTPSGTCDDGILSGIYCCSAGCGTCGGSGCSDRGSGLTGDDCCTSDIAAAGVSCGSAPCIVNDDSSGPTPTPPTPTPSTDFTCDGIEKGEYCCSAGCGTCGGSGCSSRGDGLTGEDCCTSDITGLCSVTGGAPCIIDGDSSGPTPTPPTPSPPTPTPPTPTPTPSTCSGTVASISIESDVAYFQDGGCATLTDLYNAQSGSGPLYVLDSSDNIVSGGGGSATPTGNWLVTSALEVLGGATLYIHGTSSGGDADVVRIQSTDDDFWYILAWGGNLSFKDTTVTSWDTDRGEERTEYEGGRSYINCVTQFDDSDIWTCDGRSNKERGECRMDIIDSVMGNLGWPDAESYGLTWKVRGFCKDLSNEEIFVDHNVYGDIQGSEIYGMYYGMYSYGHQGGVWTNNIMRDNVLYGFDPHDDSDYLTIADNVVYGNGNHGIIASKRCNNVEIYRNEVYNGAQAGIFLHRSADDAKVYDNYVHDNADAGIALMESFGADIHDNVIENCKYGIRFSVGCADNDIYDNSFDSSSAYGIYTYMGSDEPYISGNNGRSNNNLFDGNTISNTEVAVKIKEADDNTFTNNIFTNVDTFEFEDATGTTWTSNTIGDGCLDGSTDFESGSIPSC